MPNAQWIRSVLPPVTLLVVAVLLAVMVVEVALFGLLPTIGELQRIGAMTAPPLALGSAWRLPLSSFMHANVLHLASNVLLLTIVMRRLELVRGSSLVACTVLVSIVFVPIGAALIDGEPGVGASGIVSACIGAAIACDPRARTVLGSEAWLAAAVMVVLTAAGMSVGAHVAGAAAGASVALLWRWRLAA